MTTQEQPLTTEERLQQLEHTVSQLRVEMGAEPDFERDGYLDNPVHIRMHEIGLAIDACVRMVEEFRQRLAAIEARPTGSTQVPTDGTGYINVLDVLRQHGLYIEDGCFGFGGIDPKSAATIQVFGNKYVTEGAIQYNNPDATIVSTSALSGDRGFRQMNNQRVTKAGVPAHDPDGNIDYIRHFEVVDPTKIDMQVGTDSRQQFSIVRHDPKYPHEYTQDAVLVFDEETKLASWQLWRRGWSWALVTDGKYGPARIWRAITEIWG